MVGTNFWYQDRRRAAWGGLTDPVPDGVRLSGRVPPGPAVAAQQRVHQLVGVVQVERITRCRNEFRVFLTPAVPRNRVRLSRPGWSGRTPRVHVVAADRAVDES